VATLTYLYDPANQLTEIRNGGLTQMTLSHEANGNLATRVDGALTTSFTYSRYLAAHYPGDVLVGAAWGGTLGWVCAQWVRRRRVSGSALRHGNVRGVPRPPRE